MTHVDLAASMIKHHEGLRLTVYDDKTGASLRQGDMIAGRPTIGYGRLLDIGRGLSREEADYLLANDLKIDEAVAQQFAGPAWKGLSTHRKAVMMDMAHNLGAGKLRGFVMFQEALREGDYAKAAAEMLDSKWARDDVPDRAETLAFIMATDRLPAELVA